MIRSVIILWFIICIVGSELLPNSPYVFVGENFLLNCTVPETFKSRNLNLSSVYFTKGDLYLPTNNALISDDSVLYNITITSTNDERRYGCWIETSDDGHLLLGSQIVKVDYAPVAVTNLTCIVFDWTDGMRCDWSFGVDYVHKDFIKVQLLLGIRRSYKPCPLQTNTSCTWSSSEYRGSSLMHIHVTVENTKRDVKAISQKYLRTSQHVKPSAPTDLKVVGNVQKTCVTLNWGHERSRPKLFSVTYHLRNTTLTEKEIVGSQNITVLICGLTPYTQYEFAVKCKPEENGYWSDSTTILVTTLEDVPLSGPIVSKGSFQVTSCNNDGKRTVTLYWGEVAKDDQQGKIINYLIQSSSENVTVADDVHTLELPAEPCHQTQTYNIWSQTIIGYSQDYSQIVVPQQMMNSVSNFTIQMVLVDDMARIIGTWLPVKSKTVNTNVTYTIYWCWIHSTEPFCQDGIKWKISNRTDSLILPVDSKIWRSYFYGISVEINDISSGIKWTKCRITESAVPISPPEGIKVTEKENALEVRWKSDICVETSEAMVQQYVIRICPTNSCHDENHVKTSRVNSDKEKHLFEDLSPVNYTISLQAYSVAGAGPESQAVFAIPLNTDYRLSVEWIILITMGAFMVVVILPVCIWKGKKICRCEKFKIKTPIDQSASNQSPIYLSVDTNSPTHGQHSTSNIENDSVNEVVLNPKILSSPTQQHLLKEPVQNIDEVGNEEVLSIDTESNQATLSKLKTQTFVNPLFTTSNGYCQNDIVLLEDNTHLNTPISNYTRMCDINSETETKKQVNDPNTRDADISGFSQVKHFQTPDQKPVHEPVQGETGCTEEKVSGYTTLDESGHQHTSSTNIFSSRQQNDCGVAEVPDYVQIDQVDTILPSEPSVIGDDLISVNNVKEANVTRSDQCIDGNEFSTHKNTEKHKPKECNNAGSRNEPLSNPNQGAITKLPLKVLKPVKDESVGSDSMGSGGSSSETSVSSYMTVGVIDPPDKSGYVDSPVFAKDSDDHYVSNSCLYGQNPPAYIKMAELEKDSGKGDSD